MKKKITLDKPILVRYIRDMSAWDNNLVGCVVAVDKGKVGVSICNPKDPFNKETAKAIAIGRAVKSSPTPNIKRKVVDGMDGMEMNLNDLVDYHVGEMIDRAEKYYK